MAGERFVEADISNTDFTGRDLSGASFYGANCSACNFTSCILVGADFYGANCTNQGKRILICSGYAGMDSNSKVREENPSTKESDDEAKAEEQTG